MDEAGRDQLNSLTAKWLCLLYLFLPVSHKVYINTEQYPCSVLAWYVVRRTFCKHTTYFNKTCIFTFVTLLRHFYNSLNISLSKKEDGGSKKSQQSMQSHVQWNPKLSDKGREKRPLMRHLRLRKNLNCTVNNMNKIRWGGSL
jgi:hypothetical protein